LKQQHAAQRVSLFVFCAVILTGLLLCVAPSRTLAQDQGPYETERARAFQLIDENRYTEAMPILERLAAAKPTDGPVAFALGFSTFATSKTIKSPEARRETRKRARAQLIRARELGVRDQLLESILASIPEDGGEETGFSRSKEADEAMQEAEAAFSKGDMDKAVAAYARALRADPQLYEAALFAGDAYFKKGRLEKDQARQDSLNKAGEWLTKAIAIAPDRETAYRYLGDVLLEQDRPDEARAKFIEAIVAEPYKDLVYSGISNWANKTRTQIGHPEIKQPASNISSSGEGNQTTITLDAKKLDPRSGPQYYWSFYELTRAMWAKANFAKEYPNEKAYRHSLKEEATALKIVAEMASKDLKEKKVKTLDPSLTNLVRLYDAGLIEAYVLFARPDNGIARDYAAYRQANRDKLRRYWNEFVIAAKPETTP
jgi:tetratricopeptide (TPR) repeat protein